MVLFVEYHRKVVVLIQDLSAQKRKFFLSLVKKRVKQGSGSGFDFLHQRTWTYPVNNLNLIIKKASFVVVGGVATRLYMPERMTLDLDILIRAEDAQLIYQDLEESNAKKIGDLSIPGSQWQLADNTSVDVLEGEGKWVREAVLNPNYAPDSLPVIDLPYLVLMKLAASRTQDLADVSWMLGLADEHYQNIDRKTNNLLSNCLNKISIKYYFTYLTPRNIMVYIVKATYVNNYKIKIAFNAGQMPPNQAKKIKNFIVSNQEELMEKWHELSS